MTNLIWMLDSQDSKFNLALAKIHFERTELGAAWSWLEPI